MLEDKDDQNDQNHEDGQGGAHKDGKGGAQEENGDHVIEHGNSGGAHV